MIDAGRLRSRLRASGNKNNVDTLLDVIRNRRSRQNNNFKYISSGNEEEDEVVDNIGNEASYEELQVIPGDEGFNEYEVVDNIGNEASYEELQVIPGDEGFNEYARERFVEPIMQYANKFVCPDFNATKEQGGKTVLMPNQQIVLQLCIGPCKRLLVAARTGAGKTATMVAILTAKFDDPRAKIVLFPTNELVDNFYSELMKFPNPYQDYVIKNLPSNATGNLEMVREILSLKRQLKKANVTMIAPLRAFKINSVAGALSFGKSKDAIFKYNKSSEDAASWDDTIVVVDEAHNLKRSHAIDVVRMAKLRDAFTKQRNSDLFLFTATPADESVEDLGELLDVVKGINANEKSDEGFFSYYGATPNNVFPSKKPVDFEKQLPRILYVELQGLSRTKYIEKMKSNKSEIEETRMSKLKPYCTLSMFWTFAQKKDWLKKFIQNPTSYATKLAAVAQYVSTTDYSKTLVLIDRNSGYLPLFTILADQVDMKVVSVNDNSCEDSCFFGFAPKTNQSSKTFNKTKGNSIAIAARESFGTGVSFIGVRTLIIVDVPEDTTTYLQNVGRVMRSCGYGDLPSEDRNVELVMFAAELYQGKTKTADDFFLRKLAVGLDKNNALVEDLSSISIEGL